MGADSLDTARMTPDAFDAQLDLPRLGWISSATPVTSLPDLAASLGLAWFGVKRDDFCRPTSGGSKVRKLDVLLASAPWADASGWISVGAIGSGHLVCCAEAARRLGKSFDAHLFWQPVSESVCANLARTASLGARLTYHRSRISLALTAPGVLMPTPWWPGEGRVVIPAGGSTVEGVLGVVRGGLELAAQVHAGELPAPDVLVVALGTGGTAAGLALGLQLGGLPTRVLAVAVVERPLAPTWALTRLMRATADRLAAAGLRVDARAAQPEVVRGWLGPGYGVASQASNAACRQLLAHDIKLEPVYTGKAMAATLDLAPRLAGQRVLLWGTVHGDLPAPDPAWRDRLPARLQRRLARAERVAGAAPHGAGRRRFILATTGLLGLAGGGYRLLGYAPLPTWRGDTLSSSEARVVMALAEALLPSAALPQLQAVAAGVDRYLTSLSPRLRALSRAALFTVEHATPLSGSAQRMSRLEPAARLAHIQSLHKLGGAPAEAARGARDLVLLGWYQQPASWAAVGYEGPQVPASRRPVAARYAGLVAAPNTPVTLRPRRTTGAGVVR